MPKPLAFEAHKKADARILTWEMIDFLEAMIWGAEDCSLTFTLFNFYVHYVAPLRCVLRICAMYAFLQLLDISQRCHGLIYLWTNALSNCLLALIRWLMSRWDESRMTHMNFWVISKGIFIAINCNCHYRYQFATKFAKRNDLARAFTWCSEARVGKQ